MTYSEDANSEDDELAVYVDADYADDMNRGYPRTGVLWYFAGAPVDCKSLEQTVVTVTRPKLCGVVESVYDDALP